MATLTLTDAQMDLIPADLLADILRPTCGTALSPGQHDGSGVASWHDAEGVEWTVDAYARLVGGRWLVWDADCGAGVASVVVLDPEETDSDDADEIAAAWAADIAADLG